MRSLYLNAVRDSVELNVLCMIEDVCMYLTGMSRVAQLI